MKNKPNNLKSVPYHIVLTLGVMVCFSLFIPSAFAQEYISDNFEVWIPDKMIVGEVYEGMVSLNLPSINESIGYAESDNENILLSDNTITFLPNTNHGYFNLTPQKAGYVDFWVSYGGDLVRSDTTVYSKKSGAQKLKIILPGNSTLTDDLRGYVFLLDGNNAPVNSDRDRLISLTSSQKIMVPSTVNIKNGTSFASFDFHANASGEINAMTTGLIPDTVLIDKIKQTIQVKLNVAPNIVLGQSYTNFVISLEKDGKPFKVGQTLDVEIQSSDLQVARFSKVPNAYTNINTHSFTMYNGMATGVIYTGVDGPANIFVSIPGYGSDSELINVGAITLSGEDIIEEGQEHNYRDLEPNYIQFWVFPEVTDDKAYGVAALYHSIVTDDIEITTDVNGTQIANEVELNTMIPVFSDDSTFSISSDAGLRYSSDYLIDGAELPTHSKMFEIEAKSVGDYTLTATGKGSSDTADLKVTTTHDSQYSINLQQLPTKTDTTQPLLLVTIVDGLGNIIDISKVFGSAIELQIHTLDMKVSSDKIRMLDNVGVISGMVNQVSSITVSSNQFGSTTSELYPSGVPVSIEFTTPSSVHSGESFPLVVHEIDAAGIPVNRQSNKIITGSGFDVVNDKRIQVRTIGEQQLSVLAELGGAFQSTIETFTNYIDFTPQIDIAHARIGQPVEITIDSPFSNVEYNIDSPFPYEQVDSNTFLIIPDSEIENAEIVITGSLDGFTPIQKQVVLSSENLVEVRIDAKTVDGKLLSPSYEYFIGNLTGSNIAPHIHKINPQQTIIKANDDYSTAAGGYRFVSASVGQEQTDSTLLDFYPLTDTEITLFYDRFVNIVVNDGKGTGVYSYGDNITIEAPDKHIIPLLIIDRFESWDETSLSSSFTIKAEQDETFTANYKKDYLGLMGVVISGIAMFGFAIFKKGNSTIKYKIMDIVDILIDKARDIIAKK